MNSRLVIYPEFDARIERDFTYRVSVTQGDRTESLPVYNHTEDSRVNRNPVDDNRADEFRRFSTFAFSGEGVRVDIRVNGDFHDYSVIPAAKKFKNEFHNGVISVYLEHPDYFAIRLDGKDHTILSVFADEPESEIPTADEKTLVVDRWHEVDGGILRITEPNTTIYIPAGSVLNARVEIRADRCRVLGRGAILDPVGDIYTCDASKLDTGVVLLVKDASHTRIDGIHMLNAKAFNVEFIGEWEKSWAVDNRICNAKILATQMCTDGITFCYYTKDSYAEHCFVYCGDNALVYEEYAHYKDITIGTTCNALFPQTDVVDSSVEDAYVFRADEGIINCEYCGENGITKLENHTIKNLCAVDVTYAPYFLYTEIPTCNPVVTARGGLTVENVWLPQLSQIRARDFYRNIAAGDYQITLKNVAIGGLPIKEITSENVGCAVNYGAHTFCYQLEDGFDFQLMSNNKVVCYENDLNVFVGKKLLRFQHPVIKKDGDWMLPADQLRKALRTDRLANTVVVDGVVYVNAADLVNSGMAKEVAFEERSVCIIPNDNTKNLLLPDCGVISKFTEYICYASHVIAMNENGEIFYRTVNTHSHREIGVFRMIDEEIRTYGAGTYRLTFEARAPKSETVVAQILYSSRVALEQGIDVDENWREGAIEVEISADDVTDPKIAMVIGGGGRSVIDEFDLRKIQLFKIT